MPNPHSGAGRLIPASALEFSRYTKNLAWLLEAPLHFAQKVLVACYGFSDVHELKATIPAPGEDAKPTGPFDEPRERPSFFPKDLENRTYVENRLCRFTARELRLLEISENVLHRREEKEGRLRRRHYAVLDAGFFSVPSVHRKRFAEVKAGILAMEGTAEERERYLEVNWPPAFWSYLEATQLLRVDAQGLSELKDSSTYFDEKYVMSIADMFHDTAAHRAPAIFLAMVGDDPEALDEVLPDYAGYEDVCEVPPSIVNGRTGLFDVSEWDSWSEALAHRLPEGVSEELSSKLFDMRPYEIAVSPPNGTPSNVLTLARKWRLHQLRSLSRLYVDSEFVNRRVSRASDMFWPGSPGNTVTQTSEFVLTISRNAPSLMLYSEFAERSRTDETEYNRQFWSFKTLLTRTAPNEEEDVVGYMAGWLIVLATDRFVCDSDMLLEDVGYHEPMLAEGVEAFLKSYLPFNGFNDLLTFVNSRWHSSVAITEIVLRDKYKKEGLAPLAFTGFSGAHQNAPFTDVYDGWLEFADFDVASDEDIGEREPDVYIDAPGVFMVPVQRQNMRLRRHLMDMSPQDALDDEEHLDVFPFHFESPKEMAGSTG